MELADMRVLETRAVKSVGVRVPRGPPKTFRGCIAQQTERTVSTRLMWVQFLLRLPIFGLSSKWTRHSPAKAAIEVRLLIGRPSFGLVV